YIVGECLEAVGKSFRNVKLTTIGAREFECVPAAISRRIAPDVNDHIPDSALNATHELHFGVWRPLIVHAAQGARASGERYAVLRIICFKPMHSELTDAERASEEAAAIACGF